MSKSLNKVTLIGNVGKDPEIRYTGTGKAVVSFSLATSDSWKDKTTGQMQEKTDWHNIVAWERLAEIINQYVKKGKRIYLEGRIQTRSYDDKDGVKKYITEIVANDMIMLDGGGQSGGNGESGRSSESGFRPQSSSSQSSGPAIQEYEPAGAGAEDDLPF